MIISGNYASITNREQALSLKIILYCTVMFAQYSCAHGYKVVNDIDPTRPLVTKSPLLPGHMPL